MSRSTEPGQVPVNTSFCWGFTMESGDSKMVPATGFEPVRCYSLEPESSASANSATRAHHKFPLLNPTATDIVLLEY